MSLSSRPEARPKLYFIVNGKLKELGFKTYNNLTLEESQNRVYSLLYEVVSNEV